MIEGGSGSFALLAYGIKSIERRKEIPGRIQQECCRRCHVLRGSAWQGKSWGGVRRGCDHASL